MRELTDQEEAEVERDAVLPQLDARDLVDEEYLERAIKEMYTEVAEHPEGSSTSSPGAPWPRGWATTPRCSTGSRPRRSSPSREWATTSTSPASARASAWSTWAAGRAPTCSARPSWSAPPAGRSAST